MSGIRERQELLRIAAELDEAAFGVCSEPLPTLHRVKAAAERIRRVVYPVRPPRKVTVRGETVTRARTGTGDR